MFQSLTSSSDVLIRVLGHSLWQAALVSGFVWVTLRMIPAKHAERRHAIALGGLATIVMLAMTTWSVLGLDSQEHLVAVKTQSATSNDSMPLLTDLPHDNTWDSRVGATLGSTPNAASETVRKSDIDRGAETDRRSGRAWRVATRWLAGLWLCGSIVMLLRGLRGFVTVRQWLAEAKVFEGVDTSLLNQIVAELSAKLRLRRIVKVLPCNRIDTPAVIGVLWPVILIPVAMLAGVPVEQWRIMIAHELAHVRRWDPLVGLVQMVVESLLFFNPSVWWISRMVRAEREACCDAEAAGICGQPLSVARVLIDVAASVHRPVVATAMAIAEPTGDGELSDRVRRLAEPERAPRSKISWISLSVVLLALLTTLVLLQRGSDLAVRTAANWMSPKDRIAKLIELEGDRYGNFTAVPEAVADQIAVHVTVKTDDGSPIGPKLSLSSINSSRYSLVGASWERPGTEVAEYHVTRNFSPCRLRIEAWYPEFALATSPILTLLPGEREKVVELILTKGRPMDVVITDNQGQPIPQAWLRHSATCQIDRNGHVVSSPDQQSDDAGLIHLTGIGNSDYTVTVMAPGFQRVEYKGGLKEYSTEAPIRISLPPAIPTSVRVVDAATGSPIPEARFRITRRETYHESQGFGLTRDRFAPSRWDDYAVTGQDGKASLNQLSTGTKYSFAVTAPGYGFELLKTSSGQPEETIRLSRSIRISGRITGSLNRLEKQTESGKSGYLFYVSSHTFPQSHDLDHRHILEQGPDLDYDFVMNVDSDGYFEREGLSVGERLFMRLPDEHRDITLKQSIENMAIFVQPKEDIANLQWRDITIRLTEIIPEAPARGTLSVSWQHPTIITDENRGGRLSISNNEIRLKALVGASLYFGDAELPGYIIDKPEPITVQAGTMPQVIDIKATPAGGIYGSIQRSDGSPADQTAVSVFATKLPSSEKDHRRINPSSAFSQAEFLRSVPLGGRYRILARENSASGLTWAVSDEVTVDENNPLAKIDMTLPTGRDLRLKLLDEQGSPVKGQAVELGFQFAVKRGLFDFSNAEGSGLNFNLKTTSDESGICTFRGLSLDQPLGDLGLTLNAVIQLGPMAGAKIPIDLKQSADVIQLPLTHGL